jgi:hypothetical protein
VLAAVSGCAGNVCISDPVRGGNPVTFDFRRGRYWSDWGSGRITQVWDAPDGTHNVIVSSPPAGATLSFAADWTTATKANGTGGVRQYRCEPRGARR